MPRTCIQCTQTLPRSAYSVNQWKKKSAETGQAISRCKECVAKGDANGAAPSPAASKPPAPAPASKNKAPKTPDAKKSKTTPSSTTFGRTAGTKKKEEAVASSRPSVTESEATTVKASNLQQEKTSNTSSPTTTSPSPSPSSEPDHSEVHVAPSGTMAVCADGDDSASRSGSEDGGDVGDAGSNIDGLEKKEEEEDEHVLFEPGEEDMIDTAAIYTDTATSSSGSTKPMTTSEAMMAAAIKEAAVEEQAPNVVDHSSTSAALETWSEALESKKSSEVDLSAVAKNAAAAEASKADESGATMTMTPPAAAGSNLDDAATHEMDISAELTPRIRPARLVVGAADGSTGSAGGGPPMPLIELGEPADVASGPTMPPAPSAVAAEVPAAVHLPPAPQQGLQERRISEVTVPVGAPPASGSSAAAAAPAPALSREVTEQTSNASQTVSPAPASAPAPTPATAASTTTVAAAAKPTHVTRVSSIPAAVRDAHVAHRISTGDRIRLGICAMDKKARSKPMGEILSRLDETLFEVVFFGDDLIKNSPIEDWPEVDVLIAFYSTGYPLAKAEEYVKLRRPFVLNDLEMQWTLKDRRKVYDLLESSGIDVPRHVYMSRDGYVSSGTGDGNGEGGDLIEHDDYIEVNGVVIHKPFVEKPVDADDHNIAIYYPTSAGGGCKKLFRKVGDRSSEFYPMINEVRRDGSYIYEEFVETQGTDVKMYTVGPDYGHAEARKSPTVDGKVERNSDGKEVRFPVILSLREKEIARRIVIVFKQQVCGFDLLRVQQGDSLVSYVCDVNGWSFVKNSRKYYDDCAQILTEHMLAAVRPTRLSCFSALDPLLTTMPDNQSTPKKVKRSTTSAMQRVSRMLQGVPEPPDVTERDAASLSPARTDTGTDASSVQAPTTLSEGAVPVSQIPHQLAAEPPSIVTSAASSVVDDGEEVVVSSSAKEPSTHKEELRCVIAVIRHGDRTPKQKLKMKMSEPRLLAYFHEHSKNPKKDLKVKAKKPLEEFLKTIILTIAEKEAEAKALGRKRYAADDGQRLYKLRHMRDVLQRWKIGGLNRKLQIKPQKWEETVGESGELIVKCTEVQLILKWGGNLTKLGERQAINLGQRIRHELYPDAPGGGILRLHSTFRHDLKIKTSDEGRVMKTAAASAKGLLELEGEIPPILVSLVHKEKDSIHMLDPSGNKEVKKELEICKSKINENLQKDIDFDKTSVEEHESVVGPVELTSLHTALQEVKNPRKALFAIRATMGELLEQLDEMLGLMTSGDETRTDGEGESALSAVHIKLYKGETLLELTERWRLLYRKFYDEDTDTFDLSRVPDVHDNVRFDMLHNPHLGLTDTLERLYNMAKAMADCVVPQEYGTTILEKRSIGQKMCRALLDKIKYDLIIARTDDQVDMRYMINMEYSADLPINTMGRRVRTRLYFTSESHLHTLLNVLRFTYNDPRSSSSILSSRGRHLVDKTPELCYLTQIVFRLFEDPKKDISDPKRFRIEVLFSPGATATPLHMAEMDRDLDNSRFETDPLELISKDSLSCQEVEDYFTDCIEEGRTDEDDDTSIISAHASMEDKKKKEEKQQKDFLASEEAKAKAAASAATASVASAKEEVSTTNSNGSVDAAAKPEPIGKQSIDAGEGKDAGSKGRDLPYDVSGNIVEENTDEKRNGVIDDDDATDANPVARSRGVLDPPQKSVGATRDKSAVVQDDESIERMARILEKKYFWASVAVVSGLLGIGCLVLSKSFGGARAQRRWSTRR